MDEWLPEALMQSVAAEVNLSETAFVVPEGDGFRIRWFSPAMEIDLCGHATLAAAFALFMKARVPSGTARFSSASGPLEVTQRDGLLYLDFPVWKPAPAPVPSALVKALGVPVIEALKHRDWIAVVKDAETLAAMTPDMEALRALDGFGVIVTAETRNGYVCRCFVPKAGIPEDPVTGSAQCELVPYWAQRSGRHAFEVAQLSARGGRLRCELAGDRVLIGGQAVLVYETSLSL